ncbi:LysR family transcriptional regulator [Mycobacterium koreense]|uniref:Probable hydrogen peroxide-inducible genes activator n=1 Tax=Mycolicibacillus koreensis TaxID=1069220 RepID=A0A7I7SJZ5_9MYCO|nr:LysR family transcriptional regulator [Mycolicibacillus koreensis]MCV7250421.1 LysR family transcriptional regulator [Mycolicibacillus koreensis]OSC33323.1 LysR family transcriptional regulator [Mycolicibacillus koreensis]BBY56305.1 transcriptional regulator, LysR family protein [Mycolicibacillus koreensis]
MQLRQLEYFVALARERHFARAAAACHVSQPALSEAIRKLEHELGVPLVHRDQRFEGLTAEGERLVLWARRILADHDALRHEVTALRTGLTGQLRLGVIPAAAASVAPLTDVFCAAHPLVRVQLETSLRSADVIARIRRFELDAGIIYPDAQDTSALRLTPLYTERHVLIAAAGLLDGQPAQLGWPEVPGLPLCLLTAGMRGRRLVDAALAARGLTVTPQVETDSIATLLAHVRTGRWASIIPHTWLTVLDRPGRIQAVRLEPAVTATVVVATAANEPGSVLARAFRAVAAEHATTTGPVPGTDADQL